MKTVHFYRNYKSFRGGHLKIWDYYNHTRESEGFRPQIFFKPGSLWDETNPWNNERNNCLEAWNPHDADVLFLGGRDWNALPPSQRANWPKPIINLVQHVRHADPEKPQFEFLSNHAIRICVSQEVADAISGTRLINGPLFVIPNGIDLVMVRKYNRPRGERAYDLLIAGLKNPKLAIELEKQCFKMNLRVKCLSGAVSRTNFLDYLGNSRITFFMPHSTEGFYLPALEGMAAGTLVICPDCIGNRSFCNDGINCLVPSHSVAGFLSCLQYASTLENAEIDQLLKNATLTTLKHDIINERLTFLDLLNQIDMLWG